MARFSRSGTISIAMVMMIFVVWYLFVPLANAQSGKTKPKPLKPISANEIKQIDLRLEKLEETFSTESTAIIEGYERSGQFERAKFLLEVMLKLNPKNEAVKKRIAELEDRMLERTEFERRFDTSGDWTLMGKVSKDKPARVEASGEYKLNLAMTNIGPDGFPSEDFRRDLMAKIPTGALMGTILTDAHRKEKKAPEPFAIKSKYDFTPKEDGEIYLKVNVPPNAKCVGELKLKLAGIERAP